MVEEQELRSRPCTLKDVEIFGEELWDYISKKDVDKYQCLDGNQTLSWTHKSKWDSSWLEITWDFADCLDFSNTEYG